MLSRVLARDRLFVLSVWILSRAIVAIVMLAVAPHVGTPNGGRTLVVGWDEFAHWDGEWYARIAERGFDYARDGQQHSVAFFPLYPLVCAPFVRAGVPFRVVGPVVSNAAFLGMLFVVFAWMRERQGTAVARWAVATLCFLPLSLFGSLAYSEGTFMLLSSLALRAYDRRRFGWAGLWAALASATRITGAGLLPAFAAGAWVRRERPAAYGAGLAALLGPLAFAAFCAVSFGDPLAPLRIEASWRHGLGFTPNPWEAILSSGTNFGPWGTLRWPYQVAIAAVALGAWRVRRTVATPVMFLATLMLVAAELSLWSENGQTVLLVLCGAYLLWYFRRELGAPTFVYGLVGALVIVLSGRPISADRIAYGIIAFPLALAMLFSRFPVLGGATLTFGAGELAYAAFLFAQWYWVA